MKNYNPCSAASGEHFSSLQKVSSGNSAISPLYRSALPDANPIQIFQLFFLCQQTNAILYYFYDDITEYTSDEP